MKTIILGKIPLSPLSINSGQDHLALGNKESTVAWRDFIRDMQARGLPIPMMITSDGAPAIIAVIEELYSNSWRQRCLFHKTRNILDDARNERNRVANNFRAEKIRSSIIPVVPIPPLALEQ